MKKDILEKTIELYYNYNSTCIIDTNELTIESPDADTMHFKSDLDIIDYLLDEMILSGGEL